MSKPLWHIRLSREAERNLDAFDPPIAKRILKYLDERIAMLENPRAIGKALKGSKLGDFWRYDHGDYRIIVAIVDKEIVIHVIRIGDRKDVYR
jgi:mRNA interferase RelE/StbE